MFADKNQFLGVPVSLSYKIYSLPIHVICIFKCFIIISLSYIIAGNGSVRLVGGTTANEGRIEVYLNYFWGTVCDCSWDILDAVVVCRQLGYSSAVSAYGSAHFGAGTGPIHYGCVACNGSEAKLTDCPHGGVRYCSHRNDAGVVCDTRPNASKLHENLMHPSQGNHLYTYT